MFQYHFNAKPVSSCGWDGCTTTYIPATGWFNGMCGYHAGSLAQKKRSGTKEPPLEKICTKCGMLKSIGEFTKDKRTSTGYQAKCKKCDSERAKKYRKTESGFTSYRRTHLKKKFGITHEEYLDILESQNRACAICKSPEPKGGRKHFAIDHNHITGQVRGLLCTVCNTAIGQLDTDRGVKLLENAIMYLESTDDINTSPGISPDS